MTPTTPTSPTSSTTSLHAAVQTAGAATCPECDGPIRFDRAPLAGQVCRCGSCGVELEVTSASPVVLALAPEVEEDWGE